MVGKLFCQLHVNNWNYTAWTTSKLNQNIEKNHHVWNGDPKNGNLVYGSFDTVEIKLQQKLYFRKFFDNFKTIIPFVNKISREKFWDYLI